MSTAFSRNFAAAQAERNRRIAALLDSPGDVSMAQQGQLDPAWDAFAGSLHDVAASAAANGMGFRADLGGIGRFSQNSYGGGLQYPSDASAAPVNDAIDRARWMKRVEDETNDRQRDADIAAMKQSYDQQVAAGMNAPPIDQPNISLADRGPGQPPVITMREASSDPRARALATATPAQRAALEKEYAAIDAQRAATANQTATTNADIAAKTGAGSLMDYIRRVANDKNVPVSMLTAKDVDEARAEYLNTTAMAGIQGPKVQDAYEKDYAAKLKEAINPSSRSAFGIENGKVNQAIDLMTLADQYKDPKTGEYNIPAAQYREMAMGLASLVSRNAQSTQHDRDEIATRTAKGDINGIVTYLTGLPQNASTQAIYKNLVDSIERQGRTAEKNRDGFFSSVRALAPTNLSEERRTRLEQALNLPTMENRGSGKPSAAATPPAANKADPLGIRK